MVKFVNNLPKTIKAYILKGSGKATRSIHQLRMKGREGKGREGKGREREFKVWRVSS